MLRKTLKQAGAKVLPKNKKKNPTQKWMTWDILDLMGQRKEVKSKQPATYEEIDEVIKYDI